GSMPFDWDAEQDEAMSTYRYEDKVYADSYSIGNYSSRSDNADFRYNKMFLFEDDVIRLIGVEDNTYNAMELVGTHQFQVEEHDGGYRYEDGYKDFGFTSIDMSSQSEQDAWAEKLGHPECAGTYFRKMADWLNCVGTDVPQVYDTYMDSEGYIGREHKTVLRDMYMEYNGVWTLHVKQHNSYGGYRSFDIKK
ncbi:MAG: hypothetical protein VW995_13325, partial [Deltaproteobacteria bacterium]